MSWGAVRRHHLGNWPAIRFDFWLTYRKFEKRVTLRMSSGKTSSGLQPPSCKISILTEIRELIPPRVALMNRL